jgi:hypothetical protein
MLTWDDDVFAIDDRFYGWRRLPLLSPVRYLAIGVGAAITAVTLILLAVIRIPGGENNAVTAAVVIAASTWWVMKRVTYDTPLRVLIATFVHEITGPRAPRARAETRSLRAVRRLT